MISKHNFRNQYPRKLLEELSGEFHSIEYSVLLHKGVIRYSLSIKVG